MSDEGLLVRFGDRSDEELMELARAGWAPAFAVLVHRHAASVHGACATAPEPLDAVADVFTRAMRQLDERDAGAALTPWLLELAGTEGPVEPVPLSDGELDAVWQRLHERWPDGRLAGRHLPWRRAGIVAVLVAVAAIVPAVLLGADSHPDEEELLEIRAIPLPDDRVQVVEDDVDEDALSDFSFPEDPGEEPAPGPEQDQTTTPTDPEPREEPDAPSSPPDEDEAAPAEEPTPPIEAEEPEEESATEEEAADEDDGDDGLIGDLVGRDPDGDGDAEPGAPDDGTGEPA